MQINQISSPLLSNSTQGASAISGSTSSDNSSQFDMLLEQMLDSMSSQNSTTDSSNSLISSLSSFQSDTNTSNGIEGLSVQPQKLAQLEQIMQMSSMLSNDTSSDSDDGSDSDAINWGTSSSNNEMLELLEEMVANQNQTTNSGTESFASQNNLNQQKAAASISSDI